jgi:thioredoxin 1
LKSDKPVMVVDFGQHGAVSRMVGPIIDELSNEYEGKVVIGKLMLMQTKNAAKYGLEISQQFGFHNGEVVGKQVGVAPKQTYADSLDAL